MISINALIFIYQAGKLVLIKHAEPLLGLSHSVNAVQIMHLLRENYSEQKAVNSSGLDPLLMGVIAIKRG
jgi:hypothetical protein